MQSSGGFYNVNEENCCGGGGYGYKEERIMKGKFFKDYRIEKISQDEKKFRNYKYQFGFSNLHPKEMYDTFGREQKARKALSVLNDYYRGNLEELTVLDIGCSTGIISHYLSDKFKKVIGIDIDNSAIEYARGNWQSQNLEFYVRDGMNTGFDNESFDVVTCAQVYEHVPDSKQLLAEIKRLLKPNGICYFAAGNRLNFLEGHYKLPFLSVIPKPLAHAYLRILGRGKYYYENHLTYWGLRRLISQFDFDVVDYTAKVIYDPKKYSATEMVRQGSFKQKMAILIIKVAYWLCPTYIWLLRKK